MGDELLPRGPHLTELLVELEAVAVACLDGWLVRQIGLRRVTHSGIQVSDLPVSVRHIDDHLLVDLFDRIDLCVAIPHDFGAHTLMDMCHVGHEGEGECILSPFESSGLPEALLVHLVEGLDGVS